MIPRDRVNYKKYFSLLEIVTKRSFSLDQNEIFIFFISIENSYATILFYFIFFEKDYQFHRSRVKHRN
jgi:hypothetical protein